MALRFNPPPNWPSPPEGFVPPPGWQPDPSWEPAPEGWQFWVEDTAAEDPTRVLPASETYSASEETTRPINSHGQNQPPHYSPAGNYAAASGTEGTYRHPAQAAPSPAPKKKSKALWFILGGLLLLFVLFILFISLLISLADSTVSSSSSNGEQSSSQDIGSFATPHISGDSITYEGEGESTIAIEKPGGPDSVVWVEYSYEPANEFDFATIETYDGSGEHNESLMTPSSAQTVSGSAFMDGRWSHQNPTETIEISGEGKWKITLHPLDQAPVYSPGDVISGEASQAFIYDASEPSTGHLKLGYTDKEVSHLSLEVLPEDPESGVSTILLETEYPGFEGIMKLPEGRQLYQVDSWSGASWEITTE